MDEDCEYAYHAAEGEAARVAHEYLRRGGVVPQEADEGADKGGHVYHKFLTAGHIHDVEVARIYDVASEVGHQYQRAARYRRQAGGHTVEAVVEVGAVAGGRYEEDGDENEHYPSAGLGVASHPAGKP